MDGGLCRHNAWTLRERGDGAAVHTDWKPSLLLVDQGHGLQRTLVDATEKHNNGVTAACSVNRDGDKE